MLPRWESEEEDHNNVVTEFGTDVLYQTRGGAFFLHKEKTKHEWDEGEREHVKRVRHEFVRLSPEEASKWLLEGDVEVINNPFDDPPEASAEAEPGATLYIRVPAALKRRVDEAAANAKVSGNVWAMRCVERCLEPSPDAKLEIATAHKILHTLGEEQPAGDPFSGWLTAPVPLAVLPCVLKLRSPLSTTARSGAAAEGVAAAWVAALVSAACPSSSPAAAGAAPEALPGPAA
jgi:hypothetical protein